MPLTLNKISTELPLPQKPFALFLDIDGTLAPIAPTPDEAKIPLQTLEILQKLKTNSAGAVALVSGRSIENIDALCKSHKFSAAGQHGLEIRNNNHPVINANENLDVMRSVYEQVNAFHQDYPKLLIEYKGLSVAVHYRTAPELRDVVRALMREIIASHTNLLTLQEGKMVFEARLRGADKGKAIEQLMQQPPFSGKLPIFAGDDLTDEDGFDAVNRLGGISIKIGEGNTLATYRATINELQNWLKELADE